MLPSVFRRQRLFLFLRPSLWASLCGLDSYLIK
jgi:hypothetical protein